MMKKLIIGALIGLASLTANAAIISETIEFGETWSGVNGTAVYTYNNTPTLGGNYDPISAVISMSDGQVFTAGNTPMNPLLSANHVSPTIALGTNASQWYFPTYDTWTVTGIPGGFQIGGAPDVLARWIMTENIPNVIVPSLYVAYKDAAGTVYEQDIQGYITGTGRTRPVPVPGSLALLGVGAIGLVAARRKHSDFIPA